MVVLGRYANTQAFRRPSWYGNTIESQGWMGRLNSGGSHSFVGLAKYRFTK